MADCASGVLQARALEYARSCSASSHRRGQRAATRGVARLLTDACIEVTARSGTADELLVRVAEYPPDAVVGFAIGAVAIFARHSHTTPEHRLTGGAGLCGRGIGESADVAVQPVLKRFSTMGATFSIYGGLIMAVLLMTFSPVVSSTPTSLAECQLRLVPAA
jgi:hypothetical protein